MINEIKEALKKATPGPWSEGVKQVSEPQENYREIRAGKGFFGDKKKHQGFGITGLISPADAFLIANTPTYIRYLLDELEKADKEIAKYHKLHDDGYNEMRIMKEELEKAQKENATMKEALEFYADESTYDIDHLDKHGYIIIDQDGGEKARSVLSTLKKEESHG